MSYKVEAHDTTPLSNIIGGLPAARKAYEAGMLADLKALAECGGKRPPAVERHQAKLGKPVCTWVGGSEQRRFHIWTGAHWRVFVHNEAGANFEVDEGLSPEQAITAWNDYRMKMGLPGIELGEAGLEPPR